MNKVKVIEMNEDAQDFLKELKARPDVLGVILFGSWARGNNRPNSDVDLVVILAEGYRRTVEYRNKQAFEIIYTTALAAVDFWKTHKDECAGLWSVAKVLYDKDGTIQIIQEEAHKIIQEGKKEIDSYQAEQFKFSAEDEISAVESLLEEDPTTANLLLQKSVLSLTGLFFDLRQFWTPAPKQRLDEIKKIKPELHKLLSGFYSESVSVREKIEMAKGVIVKVFEK